MARPGVQIVNRDAPPSRGAPTDTGQFFVVGLADRGPTDRAVKVRSLQDYVRYFGNRVSYGYLYDSLETFFREGGGVAFVSRAVGPAAAGASATLLDTAGTPAPTLTVTAKSSGEWGNDLRVSVTSPSANNFQLVISNAAGDTLETSPVFASKEDALGWDSGYVTVTSAGASTLDPAVVSNVALTGGTDDRAGISNTEWNAALDRHVKSLGPGQVAMPGRTDATGHAALLAHAEANNRFALLDLADDAAGNITAAGEALQADGNAEYGAVFAPWAVIPGIAGGTERTVPYSAVQAGLEARRDRGFNVNLAAAGRTHGVPQYVTRLAREFTDSEVDSLLDAGINTVRTVYGTVMTYSYRTLADSATSPNWWQINHSRLRMAISARAEDIGQNYVFDQIDGKGLKAAEFGGAISAMLLDYYVAGALYGDNPDEAFVVDTGETVNTVDTIAAGELRAVASLRMSPHAERVVIEFVKVPITESL